MSQKGVKFVWTESAEQSFLDIKSRLASQPVLVPLDFNEPFIIAVDAFDVAPGAALLQQHDGLGQPVCFMSRKLNVHQRKYSTVEKEALALFIVYALLVFYFGSTVVTVYTDHSPLHF